MIDGEEYGSVFCAYSDIDPRSITLETAILALAYHAGADEVGLSRYKDRDGAPYSAGVIVFSDNPERDLARIAGRAIDVIKAKRGDLA